MGSSTQAYHDPEFLREVWILYAIGMLVLGLRFAVRIRTVGFTKWQGDDYMAVVVIFCYTADAATVTETYFKGSNVDYTAAQVAEFSHAEVQQVVFGSKMQLFAWYTYTSLVWSLKGCMLFFQSRLTFGLPVHNYVKALAVVTIVAYVAVFLTISCSCFPVQLNWAVSPYPPRQCTLRAQNMYVATILNVLTDGAMLAIPMPLLWKLNVPLKKKISMVVLLSSGVFVITAALVRIVMTLKAHPSALTINRWGVRETVAGIIAVNAPIVRPFFSRSFWNGDFHKPESARRRAGSSPNRTSRTIGSASLHRPENLQIYDLSSQMDLQDGSKKSAMTSTTCVNTLNGSDGSDQFGTPRETKIEDLRDLEEGISPSPPVPRESVQMEITCSPSTSQRDFYVLPMIRPPPPAALFERHFRQSGYWHRHWEGREADSGSTVGDLRNHNLPKRWRS